MTLAEKKLDKLIGLIEDRVVAPVLPVAPVAPVLPLIQSNPDDHNLLIRLDTKVDALKDDIKTLSDGVNARITDHETRIRLNSDDIIAIKTQIKVWGIGIVFVLAVIQILLRFVK